MPRVAKGDAKPRGRMTAYAYFVQICREEHKKKHPEENVVFAEFSKKCAERWKKCMYGRRLWSCRQRVRRWRPSGRPGKGEGTVDSTRHGDGQLDLLALVQSGSVPTALCTPKILGVAHSVHSPFITSV
ncbi:high mobility group [Homalodisca vitripennis]|nr:high mobility group [Homalodisca vitripennis]